LRRSVLNQPDPTAIRRRVDVERDGLFAFGAAVDVDAGPFRVGRQFLQALRDGLLDRFRPAVARIGANRPAALLEESQRVGSLYAGADADDVERLRRGRSRVSYGCSTFKG
jgi:hypothetical protein